jgi:hypothetical protein
MTLFLNRRNPNFCQARPSEKPASNTAFVTGRAKHLFAKAQGMLQIENLAWLAVPSANEKSARRVAQLGHD